MQKSDEKKFTRQKIMDVALALFAKKGFDGTSTRDICSAADVNISLISYYFGGKKELYEAIINGTVQDIIDYAKSKFDVDKIDVALVNMSTEQKIDLLINIVGNMVDYFYSKDFSLDKLHLLYREQMNSRVTINTFGYKLFKKLFASILGKDENDKEIIFRCITIIGQMHSARIMTQFSLKMLGQTDFTAEDVQLIKKILQGHIRAILVDVMSENSNAEGGQN